MLRRAALLSLTRPVLAAAAAAAAAGTSGCARAPSPLAPLFHGSIGTPNRGLLTEAAELPDEGAGYRWLRHDDHHHGMPRFVHAIERAARTVADARPGSVLSVGDISASRGGALMPHLSHRTGRDADLLLYMTTLDGAPVESPGFIHVGPDGLAWDDKGKRFLRFDVEREWLLVKTLVEDPEARVQWVFANHVIEAMLVAWARARGDVPETIIRAMDVMLEPHPGGPHDDHVHVRTECAPAELAEGCERTGPRRAWIDDYDDLFSRPPPSDAELVAAIVSPIASPTAGPAR